MRRGIFAASLGNHIVVLCNLDIEPCIVFYSWLSYSKDNIFSFEQACMADATISGR